MKEKNIVVRQTLESGGPNRSGPNDSDHRGRAIARRAHFWAAARRVEAGGAPETASSIESTEDGQSDMPSPDGHRPWWQRLLPA